MNGSATCLRDLPDPVAAIAARERAIHAAGQVCAIETMRQLVPHSGSLAVVDHLLLGMLIQARAEMS